MYVNVIWLTTHYMHQKITIGGGITHHEVHISGLIKLLSLLNIHLGLSYYNLHNKISITFSFFSFHESYKILMKRHIIMQRWFCKITKVEHKRVHSSKPFEVLIYCMLGPPFSSRPDKHCHLLIRSYLQAY